MKLINDLGGVEAFGVVSILLFVTVFTTSMIWAACQKKAVLRDMELLPLDDPNAVKPKSESRK
jgi:hypothetical protein